MRNSFMRRLASILSLAALCLSLSPHALAQQPTGGIEGSVADPTGAVVPNATITAKSKSTNQTRTVTSNADGQYQLTQLPPDMYEIRVTAPSFKTSVAKDVTVAVGANVALDFKLEVGGANEEVTIVGSGEAQIERVDNTVSGVIGTQQVQNLPLNGRNFLDLAQLQPGVEKVEGGSFDPTKANYTGVSIGGQAGRSTQISVDGGSVVDNVVGTTVQNFSQEIVQEFQLGISNVDVSSGASGTGTVNVVSRSGSNEFHGNAYLYWRDDKFAAFPGLSRLDAANGIPTVAQADRVPFDREQFGATIGGPIKKDKLFFFTNVERNHQDGSALHNPPEGPSFAGFTSNPFRETLYTGKLDWIVSSRTNLSGRYSFDDNFQQTPFAPGSGITPRETASHIFDSNDQIVTNRAHSFVANLTHSFSSTMTNNFVFNLSDFSNVINPATEGVPEIRILGSQLWKSGTNYITPQSTFQERHQLREDLTKVWGNHTWRFGIDYERTSINGQFAFAKPARIRLFDPSTNGLSIPTTEAEFLAYPVRDISMGIGNDILPFASDDSDTRNHRFQPYFNDSWKVRQNLTLNLGLAYRYDTNLWNHDLGHPAVIAPLFGKGTAPSPSDKNNWSPRVGFAWDVNGNGRTVVRGGFGMYYDTAIDNLRLFERADLGRPGSELFLIGADLRSPLFPCTPVDTCRHDASFGATPGAASGFLTLAQALALVPAARANIEQSIASCTLPTGIQCEDSIGLAPSGPIFSTEFQVPYSLQYSIGVQRELPWKMMAQVDFNYRKGVHEVIIYDANHSQDLNTGPRTAFENAVPYADSSGFSTYKAMLLRVDRRFSNGFQMTASYALSRFKAFGGDALGLGATVTDLNDIRKEFGPAGLDRTHRFVVSAIYDLPFGRNSSSAFKRHALGGWQVSMISTAFSGQPFSVFLPNFVDLSRSGTFQTYLPGTGEGSIGRTVRTAAELNSLIDAYNASIPHLGEPCEADPTERCDAGDTSDPNGFFHDPIVPLAHVPNDTLLGGDSIISQDVRVTKTFSFGERMRLDLIGEVFNLFNVANLTTGGSTAFTLNDADTGGNPIPPSERTTSVFGTGGPRAFQFAVKFRF
jgi:hypothetical protein